MDIITVIQETATWIEKVNPDINTNLFRTETLSPHYYYYEIPANKKSDVLNQVISKRSKLLKQQGISLIPVSELHKYGKIMVFDPDSTVLDGAPEAESGCYIDIGDAPSWDTWLATGEQLNTISFYQCGNEIDNNYLIAWVPEAQYFYANGAVEVACVDNLAWSDNEFITPRYQSVKKLFSAPAIIPPVSENINYEKRAAMSAIVNNEKENYALLYYKHASTSKILKKSFWDKVVFWRSK